MTKNELDQLIKELENKLGPLPENLDKYVEEGEKYDAQGDSEKAGAIYNHASKVAPSGHPVHAKRLANIESDISGMRK